MCNKITPPSHLVYACPFEIQGHLALIFSLSEEDIYFEIDPDFQKACAYFESESECEAFAELIN